MLIQKEEYKYIYYVRHVPNRKLVLPAQLPQSLKMSTKFNYAAMMASFVCIILFACMIFNFTQKRP
jgi:hypothetical protein